jgi:trk system potassium uptake protein TrkH
MSLIYGFLIIALAGAGLLLLPIASKEPGTTDLLTCIFTASSAVTVTGLVTVDTLDHWTLFGQAVILSLIFIGGLGFMTGAAFLIILIGQELGLQNRLIVREGLGAGQLGGITVLVRNIVIFAMSAQVTGFLVLWIYWTFIRGIWDEFSLWNTLWLGLFHGISAFNNAGIEVLPDDIVGGESLIGFNSDYITLFVFAVLIFAGSTGYVFWSDVWRKRRFGLLRLDSKLVLIGTVVLFIIGFVTYAVGEWNNNATSGEGHLPQKISDATFHSVTTRSSGFAAVSYRDVSTSTDFSTEALMFIGGVSGTTGGGIKVNTFMVIILAVLMTMTGRSATNAFRSQIPSMTVQRALVVGTVSGAIVILVAYLALQTQSDLPFRDVFFEVVSAAATVGLSTGITPELNAPTQMIVIVSMFLGRFGPLSLALLMAGRQVEERFSLPAEEVRIG